MTTRLIVVAGLVWSLVFWGRLVGRCFGQEDAWGVPAYPSGRRCKMRSIVAVVCCLGRQHKGVRSRHAPDLSGYCFRARGKRLRGQHERECQPRRLRSWHVAQDATSTPIRLFVGETGDDSRRLMFCHERTEIGASLNGFEEPASTAHVWTCCFFIFVYIIRACGASDRTSLV